LHGLGIERLGLLLEVSSNNNREYLKLILTSSSTGASCVVSTKVVIGVSATPFFFPNPLNFPMKLPPGVVAPLGVDDTLSPLASRDGLTSFFFIEK